MKKIVLSIFICLSLIVSAQSDFTVSGNTYHVDEVQKQFTYQFGIEQGGTFSLVLQDSATTWVNYAKQIKLTEKNSIKEKAKYRIITHFSRDGQDSVVNYYRDNRLIKSFNKTLDRDGRVRSTALVNYENQKKNKAYNYLYKDTVIDDWKVSSQYVYATYARQFRSFNHRIDAYISKEGDTIKLVTVTNTKDSTVSYPSRKFSFRKNRYARRSGNIDYYEEVELTPEEFVNHKRLILKYLEPVKYKITDYRYKSMKYDYYNADRTLRLKITKTDTERSVVLTQKIKQ